jgi:hypothetical protein
MIVYPAGLDAIEVDALQTDRYLDALLSAVERRVYDVPADPAVDPTIRLAARRLRDEVVRTHPSFRFEERLARRLADAAGRMRLAAAVGGEAEAAIVPFPTPLLADPSLAAELANPELAALLGARYAAVASGDAARGPLLAALPAASADRTPSPFRPIVARPLLVGGALTSAALSLAGAAFVAWRLTRGAPADPMAVAVRAARAAREAAAAAATQATAATTAATTAVDAALGHRRLA